MKIKPAKLIVNGQPCKARVEFIAEQMTMNYVTGIGYGSGPTYIIHDVRLKKNAKP